MEQDHGKTSDARDQQLPTWRLEDTCVRLDEIVERAVKQGPQIVARHGKDEAVIVSVAEWRRLVANRDLPSFKDVLLSPEPKWDDFASTRRSFKHRAPPDLED